MNTMKKNAFGSIQRWSHRDHHYDHGVGLQGTCRGQYQGPDAGDPRSLSYVLSFVYIGIYWNNHHHMLYAVEKINGAVLWANLNLLFWLSLIPFVTAWMGENHFTRGRSLCMASC